MSIATRVQEFGTGAAVEVAYAVPAPVRMSKTVRGRLRGFAGGELYVEVGGSLRRFAEAKVRYISPVDEAAHCASFRVGEVVRITKYGGQYNASVEDVGRTRLAVLFQTRGGKTKRQRIPAIDCERVLR